MIEFDGLKPQYVEKIHSISTGSIKGGWSLDAFKTECKKDNVKYCVALNNGDVIGFIGISTVLDEADITNIAVDKNNRNSGIATELINNISLWCKENNIIRINLEVRETNTPAINLYKKTGFIKCGVRTRYYQDTGESAILMAKQI